MPPSEVSSVTLERESALNRGSYSAKPNGGG